MIWSTWLARQAAQRLVVLREQPSLVAPIAQVIEAAVGDRPIEIGQVGGRARPLEQIEEQSLHQILGLVAVLQHAFGLSQQRRSITPVELHQRVTDSRSFIDRWAARRRTGRCSPCRAWRRRSGRGSASRRWRRRRRPTCTRCRPRTRRPRGGRRAGSARRCSRQPLFTSRRASTARPSLSLLIVTASESYQVGAETRKVRGCQVALGIRWRYWFVPSPVKDISR